jgi:ribonucleotide monophosphatase NagD (HAD superfamily)
MVLTGVSTIDDLKHSDFQPTWIMSDISELTRVLRQQNEA